MRAFEESVPDISILTPGAGQREAGLPAYSAQSECTFKNFCSINLLKYLEKTSSMMMRV